MRGYSEARSEPYAYDPDGAQALLAEAGYGDGFAFGLKCPNNRYLNDEAVCQAVTGMLAQVGITAELARCRFRITGRSCVPTTSTCISLAGRPASTPSILCASLPIPRSTIWAPGTSATFQRVDELLPQVQSELNEGTRRAMLDEVAAILQDEVAYVPLYVQPLLWGTRSG